MSCVSNLALPVLGTGLLGARLKLIRREEAGREWERRAKRGERGRKGAEGRDI